MLNHLVRRVGIVGGGGTDAGKTIRCKGHASARAAEQDAPLGAASHEFAAGRLGGNRKVHPLAFLWSHQNGLVAERRDNLSEVGSHRQPCMITCENDTHDGGLQDGHNNGRNQIPPRSQ